MESEFRKKNKILQKFKKNGSIFSPKRWNDSLMSME